MRSQQEQGRPIVAVAPRPLSLMEKLYGRPLPHPSTVQQHDYVHPARRNMDRLDGELVTEVCIYAAHIDIR